MTRIFLLLSLVLFPFAKTGSAQTVADVVWVQIEARPTREAAEERAAFFAQSLPDVAGFALQGGWYAIALGPYTPDDADAVIASYRSRGLIPSDSYIAFSSTYGAQYFPPGENILGLGSLAPQPSEPVVTQPDAPAAVTEDPARPVVADRAADTETPAEARRSEAALDTQERQELQTALRWAGVYDAAIDGAFGRGTRTAMAEWQSRNGFDATGILTTLQRRILLDQYGAILDGLEMAVVRDTEAGIEVKLPTGAVSFTGHEAPFAQFDATGDLAARVLLISQQGGPETLKSLYDIMQTLSIVPLDGPRRLDRDGFTLVGRDSRIVSMTEVTREGDEIKGFTLVWPAGDEARRTRVLDQMRASFRRLPGTLDPAAGQPDDQRVDLVAGLEIRRPMVSRSGFYVDGRGSVVTTADAVRSCSRITLDDQYDATLTGVDTERGIAVLRPSVALAPPAVARFSPLAPRLQSDIAVAGYSFEGQLGAPSVTFGTLSDLRGLSGEADVNRLAVKALPGDAGGPVLDDSGNVLGMLLPAPSGTRQLPEEVRFALTSDAIMRVLESAGLSSVSGEAGGPVDPVDITDRGIGMTVLVSCWE